MESAANALIQVRMNYLNTKMESLNKAMEDAVK
jgi:hypothetical protein